MSRGVRAFLLAVIGLFVLLGIAGVVFDRATRKPDARITAAAPYRTQYAALRQRLRALAGTLPDGVREQVPEPPLSPPINYSAFTPPIDERNTEALMYEQLLDPDVDDVRPFNLRLSGYLIEALQWTGDRHPQTYRAREVPPAFMRKLELGLKTRYLAVARVSDYEPVVVVDERTFRGGTATITGLLVDLQNNDVRCVFTVAATTPDRFQTYAQGKENVDASLQGSARAALCASGRAAFFQRMLDVCGGRVRSEEDPDGRGCGPG